MVMDRIRKMLAGVFIMTFVVDVTACETGQGGQVTDISTEAEESTQSDKDSPAWKMYAKEPVTLDWYVNYSWFATPWGENAVSKKITEETGVNINFITPIGNETEKLNALIASDSLPDLITLGYWEPQVKEMIEGNMVYALNELADDYDAYFWQVTDAEYVKWLKMFRELGEEGLLANDIFVDTRTQMEEKLAQGRYFCMLYQYSDMLSQQKALYEKNPDSIYMAVEGPRNSAGDDPTLPISTMNGWTLTFVSKNCKNPERAIAFINYMLSEHGQMLVYLGVEGVTYDMVDGKPVLKEEVSEILNSDRETYDRLYGADDAYWMFQNNVMQLQWKQKPSPATAQLIEWVSKYTVYNGQYDVAPSMNPDIAALDDKCTKLWSETLPKLLLAPDEARFDEIFREFVEKRDAMGYQEILKEKTTLMNAAKEKMGMNE